jgi:hypothetical protein
MALVMYESRGMDRLSGLPSRSGLDSYRALQIDYKVEAITEARAHGRPS